MPAPPLPDKAGPAAGIKQPSAETTQQLIYVSQYEMGTDSQYRDAVDKTIKPIQRVRATKEEIEERRQRNQPQDEQNGDVAAEESSDSNKKKGGIADLNAIDMSDSDYEDNADSQPVDMDEEDEDDSISNTQDKRKQKQKKDLMQVQKLGVNNGKTKKEVNQESRPNKKVVPVKPGKVKDNERRGIRTKERSITEIIEKVSTWRKLYNGVMVEGRDGK